MMEKIERQFEKRKERERPLRTHTNYGREVVENLNLKPKELFVDVGSGIGLATIMAAEEKAKAIGIDFNKENVKFAKDLAKLFELVFLDKETAKNLSSVIEKEKNKSKDEKELEKLSELSSSLKKISELPLKEKEELRGHLLDLMPLCIFDFYKDLYLELKWKDPYLDEKLEKTDLPKNVNFFQGDASHLPLKSNFADKILSADVIYWIPEENQKKALKEILRIAKNGALLEVFYNKRGSVDLKEVAKEKNINLEEIGRKKVGLWKGLGTRPIYKVIKPEEK